MRKIIASSDSNIVYINSIIEKTHCIYAYYMKSGSTSGVRILCRIDGKYYWRDLTIGNVNCGITDSQSDFREALEYGNRMCSNFGVAELENQCELKIWANDMEKKANS